MPNIPINSVDFYYETCGAGEPLMLVSGLASDSQSWQSVAGKLSKDFLVITPDNRGSGRTTPQDADTSIQQMADDCMVLAKHLGLTSFNLLGHSMGGGIAMDIAIRYPKAVTKLVLAGAAATNSKRNNALFSDWASALESGMNKTEWFRNIFYWLFTADFFDNKEAVDLALKFAIAYPYAQSTVAFRKQIETIKNFDYRDQLSNITAQTLVLSGEHDIIFPPDASARVAQGIPQSTFSIIKNAAHSIHMEQPQAFVNSVLEFINRQQS